MMLLLMSYIYLYMFIPTSINYVTLKSRSDNLQFDPNLSWQGLDRFPHIQPWRTALSAALSSFTEATWMGTTAERHMLNTHQPFINPSTQRCHVLPGLHLSSAVLWKAHFFKRFQEPLHSVRVETENSGGWVSLGQIPKSGDATCHTLYALDEIWGWKQPSWRIRGWG